MFSDGLLYGQGNLQKNRPGSGISLFQGPDITFYPVRELPKYGETK